MTTTSDTTPAPGFTPSRRSVLIGGASAAVLATVWPTGTATAAPPTTTADPPTVNFDFDNGNFIRDLIITRGGGVFPEEGVIGPMDASIYIWITTFFQLSWFDAAAPYHPTAVGIHSRIARRPASESATNRNINIAGLYASLRVLEGVFPERVPVLRAGFIAVGMDPDDRSEDATTPVGIGNIAGSAIARARMHDGMNHLGDIGRKYNGKPFEDYTHFVPPNSAYRVVNPSRWQPAISPHMRRVGGGPGDKGIWIIQKFVTPQLRLVKPYTYRDPAQFRIARPDHTDHTDRRAYKRSVDRILDASASLTDAKKLEVEWFDNKLAGIALAPSAAAISHDLDLHGWIQLYAVTAMARFDDLIAAWHQKNIYQAVRPFTAVRHVYGHRKVTAWGGPGKGTVSDMPADEWLAYLPVGDHPEYPSGSTTLCSAEAQAARRFLGDDDLDWTVTFPAGSALTERNVPAQPVTLSWPTWTAFTRRCADSRVEGGVHFQTTVDRSIEWGAQFGDRANVFLRRHITGEA
jgi:hypothetical protein